MKDKILKNPPILCADTLAYAAAAFADEAEALLKNALAIIREAAKVSTHINGGGLAEALSLCKESDLFLTVAQALLASDKQGNPYFEHAEVQPQVEKKPPLSAEGIRVLFSTCAPATPTASTAATTTTARKAPSSSPTSRTPRR